MTTAAASFRGGDMSVFEGRDGWLFLDKYDGMEVLGVYTDPRTIPEPTYASWVSALAYRREYFADVGIAYLSLLVPDSCLVYADKLPGGIDLVQPTPFDRLAAQLDEATRAQCVYPLTELISGRTEHETFQTTDSHWTDWGAYLGYRAAMEALQPQVPNLYLLEPERLTWESRQSFGALGVVMTPERSEVVLTASIVDDPTYRVTHLMTNVRDAYTVVEQDRPDLPTAVIFRDSAMTCASKFFSQSFRRVVYVSSPNTVLYDLIEQERPDVVIHEFGERRILHAPIEPTTRDFRAVFGDLLLSDPTAVADQRRATSLLAAGKFDEALAASDAALAKAPPNARLMVFRSRAYIAAGDPLAALEALRHACLLDTTDAYPHFLRGKAMRAMARPVEALAAFDRAIALEPRQELYWPEAIVSAIESTLVERAVAIATEAVLRFPNSADLRYALACAHTEAGQLEAAETAIRQGLEIAPETLTFRRQLASILVRLQRWTEAEQLLLELDGSAPGDEAVIAALSHIRRHAEQAGRVAKQPLEGSAPVG